MIPDIDIWRAAAHMTQCFRRDAASQATRCADELQAAGEVERVRDVEAHRSGDRAVAGSGAGRRRGEALTKASQQRRGHRVPRGQL